MTNTRDLKSLFLLDPKVIFLNHGSFGAAPRPVFEAYQSWQRRLERQPVRFIAREMLGYLQSARQNLGSYLHAPPDDLVFVPNATFALNIVARSLDLQPGDEILTSDHEYGACNNLWDFICQKTGAHYVQQPIPLPVSDPSQIVEQLWRGVTPHTKIIFLSHISSPTALKFPVEEVCRRARQAGLLTLIDGAHAPGQIPLDLQAIQPDFYVGNCHKWMLSPKGAGFLYTRPERQNMLEPLVVSWGWGENCPYDAGSRYLNLLEWWGTKDPAAYLSVPAAIQFQQAHDWEQVRQECRELAIKTRRRIDALTGLAPIYPEPNSNGYLWFQQMVSVRLPDPIDTQALSRKLYDEYRIEVPFQHWHGHNFMRLSFQGYNDPADAEALLDALQILLH
jgi:isopenicillin-N epimerase